MTVTVDQLRNLADRAGTGLTPDEQQRLRDGIDALHAERADAWQKFATVAAQRDRLRTRMNTLADRWEHALGVDKPYARTLRAEISIEPFGTDNTSPTPAIPPDITHRWTWTDGSARTDLPDWLTRHHHWHHDRPVIHTIDGPRTLYTGWIVALWTDGVITVGSTTVAQRVYGPDGLAGRLEHAEYELNRHAEAEAADIAAGSYARRVEELEAAHDRIRRLAARIRQGVPWASNFDDLADRILAAVDGEQQADADAGPEDLTGAYMPDPPIGCLTPAAVPDGTSVIGPPPGISLDEARQMRDELLAVTRPAESDGLRARLAHTLRTTPNQHATDQLGFPDHHGPSEGYLGWCALCTRDVETLTEALLTAITEHLEIGEGQAWCRYCRRAWDGPTHRCESDAEQRVQKIAELRDRWIMAGAPPLGQPISRWWDRRLAELNAELDPKGN